MLTLVSRWPVLLASRNARESQGRHSVRTFDDTGMTDVDYGAPGSATRFPPFKNPVESVLVESVLVAIVGNFHGPVPLCSNHVRQAVGTVFLAVG